MTDKQYNATFSNNLYRDLDTLWRILVASEDHENLKTSKFDKSNNKNNKNK